MLAVAKLKRVWWITMYWRVNVLKLCRGSCEFHYSMQTEVSKRGNNTTLLIAIYLLLSLTFISLKFQTRTQSQSKFMVKMTLRSAARPQRALARHLAGTCISLGTLQSHLCFTPITLVIHSFLSRSHFFHLWVTWSAKCPVSSFWFNIRQVSLIVSPWRTTIIWLRDDLDQLVWLVILGRMRTE